MCLFNVFLKISKVLSLVLIDEYQAEKHVLLLDAHVNEESSKNDIANAVFCSYEYHIKMIFTHGYKSFMSSRSEGDRETFYLHCLRHYIPKMLKVTYERHSIGLGDFTMEGF